MHHFSLCLADANVWTCLLCIIVQPDCFFCRWACLVESTAWSSAYSQGPGDGHTSTLTNDDKKIGERIHFCPTPDVTSNSIESVLSRMTF